MKFVGMVNQVDRPDLDRALWVCKVTGKHVVTVYFPVGPRRPWSRTCIAFEADLYGRITDGEQLPAVTTPESAWRATSLPDSLIHLASRKALWHVAAIRALEERKFA